MWNKNIFGNELQEVVGANSMIDELERLAKTKVHNALAIQENFWASKSRVRWLQLAKSCSMNNDLFNLIPNMVDLADNSFLEVVPSPSEIKDIHCWEIMKYDVCRAGYNNNFITLIPKEQSADILSKFQPICMGNFIFKIIPKILLISEEQGAFLKGKQISSNICMASELLNSFPKKLHVLNKFGFIAKFVSWVKQILHSANISIEGFSFEFPRGFRFKNKFFQIRVILGVDPSIQTICYQKIAGCADFFRSPRARLLRPLLERIRDKLLSWKGKILISWDKVCKPIKEGSLGLRRLRDVNFSILMKLAQNFIFAKYFKEDTSMRSTPHVSSVRPSLLKVWPKLLSRCRWIIGNVSSIDFWKDVWVGNTSLASQSGLLLSTFKNSKARVSHFISGNPQAWCFPMVHSTILNEFLRAAFGIDLPHAPIPDQRIWKHTISGKCIHPRVSLMSWKVVNNAIAIDEKIMKVGLWRYIKRFVLGSFSGPIPMGTNYLVELNAFIYGVEYIITKGFTNVWIEFLIANGYAVGDNIWEFVFDYSITMQTTLCIFYFILF
ncbi:hypothetical protein AMTRI_Chr03g142650 [Amborella trichopoda]